MRSGGTDRFNDTYLSTYRTILGCVYFVVLDREVAAEITHEAFLRLWQHRDEMPAGSNEKAWLIRVATNLAVSQRRSLAAAWRRKGDSPDSIDPGAEALNHIELARMRRALLRLRPQDRAVVALRFDQGLGFAEIGITLGRPENTVKTSFHRALARLRRDLDDAASSDTRFLD